VDTTAIGHAAAKVMDRVAEEFGEGAKLEAAGVIVDVSFLAEDGTERTSVQWKFVGSEGQALSAAHSLGISRMLSASLSPSFGEDDEE
jgi:hypothetical protein